MGYYYKRLLIMANVKFNNCTEEVFASLKSNGNLTVGALYFINDTGSIVRATGTSTSVRYGQHVEFLASDYDFANNAGKEGVLYICNGAAKIYSGSSWSTVFQNSVTDTVADGNSNPVSSDAVYDYLTTNYTKGKASGNIPVLDANGKLDTDVIPALALNHYIDTVSSKSALTSLSTAQKGDWAKVVGASTASENGTYILNGAYDTASNWILMADSVDTVTVDASITSNSSNPVQASAIYTALAGKIDIPASGDSGKFLCAGSSGTYSWTNPLEWQDLTSGS